MEHTIHDVARIAGVGIGTVSRVLNNNPNVKATTREKVLAVIAQLNYKPNPIARSMISRRTNSIGVMGAFFTRPFHIEILRSIEAALHHTSHQPVLYNIETNAQRDAYLSDLPMRRRVDGLLIISLPVEDSVALGFKKAAIPTVLLDTYSPLLTSLVVNNVEGAYQAVKYLIKKGHRRIGFINGLTNEGNFKFNQANDRLIGFHRALGEADLLFDPEMMLTSEWNREAARATALQLLARSSRPTAIFAASDIQAVGVLEAARSLNIRVPEELSLIGFDGIELSELLDFSTVQQPIEEMGFLSVQKLIEHIAHPETQPELIRLNTTLVERHTTAFSL
jgi:LacI family transcriptional regulator